MTGFLRQCHAAFLGKIFPKYRCSLRIRLQACFILLFVGIMTILELVHIYGIPYTAYIGEAGMYENEVLNNLSLVADLKKERLLLWLEERKKDAAAISHCPKLAALTAELHALISNGRGPGVSMEQLRAAILPTAVYRAVASNLDHLKSDYRQGEKLQIVEASTGAIIASTQDNEVGEGIGRMLCPDCCAMVMRSNNGLLCVLKDSAGNNKTDLHFSSAVDAGPASADKNHLEDKKGTGLFLIMHVDPAPFLSSLLLTDKGLGESGEISLVDKVEKVLAAGPAPKIYDHLENLVQESIGNEGSFITEDNRGVTVLAALRHIRVTPETVWEMVVKKDKAEVFAPLEHHLLCVSTVSAIFLIIVLSLTVLIANWLTWPIKTLANTAQKIKDGDLSARAHIVCKDELGVLAATFNTMVEQLQNWHIELEKTVRSRTLQLDRKNRELEREILDRLRAEDELRQSLDFLSVVLDSMNEGLAVIDVQDLRILRVNNALLMQNGLLGAEEVLGRTCYEVTHNRSAPCSLPDHFCPLQETVATGKFMTAEHVHYTFDGLQIYTEISTSPIKNQEGKVVQVVHLSRDITRKKLDEQERLRLATAIEQTVEGCIITDQQGNISYVNPAMERLSGYAREEVIGRPVDILIGDQPEKTPLPGIWDIIQGGRVMCGHFTGRRKNGAPYDTETTISPIRDSNGEIINHVFVQRDITHEKEVERKLLQAQKMEAIGTLAGGVAHDFNNILTAILGFAQLAKYNIPAGNPSLSDLDDVIKAGRRARDLVRQILAFSRQSEQVRQPMQLASIIKEAIKLLRATIPATIEIVQEIDPNSGPVMADPTQIHQVLMNLCTNAYHAMREKGGTLLVGLADVTVDQETARINPGLNEGDYLLLTVSDTGQGIEQAIVDRIFEPYFTTKGVGEGTGLGLSVVHGIVIDLGGIIKVESQPGKGSTFTIYLPRVRGEVAVADTADQKGMGGAEHILLVDDEPAIVHMGQKLLSRLGYTVTTRVSSIEAWELFRHDPHRFDLVITDQTMPHLTGIELSREISRLRPDMPIILPPRFNTLITPDKARQLGISEFVMKPLIPHDLEMIVRQVLDRRGSDGRDTEPGQLRK